MPKHYVKLFTWFTIDDDETDPMKIASMTRDGMLDMGMDEISGVDFYAEVGTEPPPSYKGVKAGWKPRYGKENKDDNTS